MRRRGTAVRRCRCVQRLSVISFSGFVMFSIDHPDILPPQAGYTRISLDTSGCVLSPYPGPSEGGRERGGGSNEGGIIIMNH